MSPALPTVSIVIPTLNEEAVIGALLDRLVVQQPDEIIVADGDSTDRTAEIAARRARVVRSAPGRGIQMNAGAQAATGDALFFLHADVRPGDRAVAEVRRAARNPRIVGGNFDLRFEGGDIAASVFTRINRARRRFGIFYGDSGIFCRRSLFQTLGGYRPWPVMEDYEFARRLWKAGPMALLDEPIWVSARRWRRQGLFRTLWSWFWVQTLYLAGVSPHRLARMYRAVR
ncbi:MAG: TIGR04283 family arsenosugar biosynthesis glycosyltransferase [Bryobacteraceae bacterium]|nr:TIGR04283 family arsenosugar biosynthesis glycosyltransferase [Bryobacteraceae bacterium]